jgi:DNA-directed RNA polymerase subunit RPC12/RpoP
MKIECPKCGFAEDQPDDADPKGFWFCKKCSFQCALSRCLPAESLPRFFLKYWCETCGKTYRIEPQEADHSLRCHCGRDIILPHTQRWYLRSIRAILLYFMWLSIAGLILGTLIALAN